MKVSATWLNGGRKTLSTSPIRGAISHTARNARMAAAGLKIFQASEPTDRRSPRDTGGADAGGAGDDAATGTASAGVAMALDMDNLAIVGRGRQLLGAGTLDLVMQQRPDVVAQRPETLAGSDILGAAVDVDVHDVLDPARS